MKWLWIQKPRKKTQKIILNCDQIQVMQKMGPCFIRTQWTRALWINLLGRTESYNCMRTSIHLWTPFSGLVMRFAPSLGPRPVGVMNACRLGMGKSTLIRTVLEAMLWILRQFKKYYWTCPDFDAPSLLWTRACDLMRQHSSIQTFLYRLRCPTVCVH